MDKRFDKKGAGRGGSARLRFTKCREGKPGQTTKMGKTLVACGTTIKRKKKKTSAECFKGVGKKRRGMAKKLIS